jgi:probable rRNA maturation factor
MTRTVAITNRHPRLRLDRRAVARVIHILDANFDKSPLEKGGAEHRGVPAVPPGELSIVFLPDPALAKIHGDFMDDPTATDVITFAGDKATGLAGEICVSADMAARYVGEGPAPAGPRLAGTRALQDAFSTELTLYIVHGWLHLAGYDDRQPARKRRMRAAEKRAMRLLRSAKAVPGFRLAL